MPLSDLACRTWDAAIIGAGPAGALAARSLAQCGRSTLLLDRLVFPRYKVCGGCLNGRSLAALDRAGLSALPEVGNAPPLHRFVLAAGGHTAALSLPVGKAVSRDTFDQALADAAVASGTVFCEGIAARVIDQSTDAIRIALVHGEEISEINARVCLVAAGLSVDAAIPGGETSSRIAPWARIGLGALLADECGAYESGTIYMASCAEGYVGLVKAEGGALTIAAAFDPAFVRRCGGPADAVARTLVSAGLPVPGGVSSAAWRGTPPLTRAASCVARGRWLLIGDSAAYIEPFTGEGMAWAMDIGLAAASFVDERLDRWDDSAATQWAAHYRKRVASSQRRCRLIAAGLRRPSLVRLAVGALRRAPIVARPIVLSLNRPAPEVTP